MAGRPKESVSPSPLRGARPRRSLGGVTVLLRRRVMSNSSTCSEQKTLDQIYGKLNDRKVATARGGRWSHKQVSAILGRSPA